MPPNSAVAAGVMVWAYANGARWDRRFWGMTMRKYSNFIIQVRRLLNMSLGDFDYPLSKDLIAQKPISPRDTSRLLVADRVTKKLNDKTFTDILDYIPRGDLLVLNDTKVFPARIIGEKK